MVDELDRATLAKAFRGELVPQDPNDEPAADLLARLASNRDNPAASTTNGRVAQDPAVVRGPAPRSKRAPTKSNA